MLTNPIKPIRLDHLQSLYQKFPQTTEELNTYALKAKQEALLAIEKVKQVSSHLRNFKNTFYALDVAETALYYKRRMIEALSKTHPNSLLRDLANRLKNELVDFSFDLFKTQSSYRMCQESLQNLEKENFSLSNQKMDYLQQKMLHFKKDGLHLPLIDFLQIKDLQLEINRIESLFLKNIDEDTSFILVDKNQLLGLSEQFIESLHAYQGLKKLTCQYPHYFSVMRTCQVESTRRRLYRAFENRAAEKNLPLLKELAQKRELLAKQLGYPSFAHLDLADQLAETPETVESFILALKEGIQQKLCADMDHLIQNLPEGITLDYNGHIKPWDLLYLQEKYKQKFYQVDETALQNYFPFERTLNKMMKMFADMFALKIDLLDSKQKGLWDTTGWIFSIKDIENLEEIKGYIILDPFPREGKFPHGYCFDLKSPYRSLPNSKAEIALALILVNFTAPDVNTESLLRHDEVITLFHEFGHAFHLILGEAEMPSRSGYHIQRDALEWPSRLFEFLAWEKETLEKLGEHFETGEKIPKELIEKKIQSKNALSGLTFSRYFYLALFSLKCFWDTHIPIHELREIIEKEFLPPIAIDPQVNKEASFLHLAEHFYRSKFYAYFWADVFAFDTYAKLEELKNQGCKKGWLQFRHLLLNHGGGLNPNVLVNQFLGRPPTIKTYIEGISKS